MKEKRPRGRPPKEKVSIQPIDFGQFSDSVYCEIVDSNFNAQILKAKPFLWVKCSEFKNFEPKNIQKGLVLQCSKVINDIPYELKVRIINDSIEKMPSSLVMAF